MNSEFLNILRGVDIRYSRWYVESVTLALEKHYTDLAELDHHFKEWIIHRYYEYKRDGDSHDLHVAYLTDAFRSINALIKSLPETKKIMKIAEPEITSYLKPISIESDRNPYGYFLQAIK